MKYIVLVIAVVIVFIIIKFIYDSYLTNNTEENWQEFKKSDPETAHKIENSKLGAKKNHESNYVRFMPNHELSRNDEEDTFSELSFTELNKVFFEKYHCAIDSGKPLQFKEELITIQEELEYHILHFEYLLDEIEKTFFKNPKNGIIMFKEKCANELKELVDYNFKFKVEETYVFKRIDTLTDKLYSLEKLIPRDESRPF